MSRYLDESTADAWRGFQARLADHIHDMQDDDLLLIEVEEPTDVDSPDGCAPYAQFCAWGEVLVRAELSSNAFLHEYCRLDSEGMERLLDLGWLAPTCAPDEPADPGSVNYHLDAPRREADRLAFTTVTALRDVFGVVHPAFLAAEDLLDKESGGETSATDAQVCSPEPAEPIAVYPKDPEHLRDLVDAAVTPVLEGAPRRDEDGDIPVVNGSAVVFVRVLDDTPTIRLFAQLVRDVTDRERAVFELAVLNRDHKQVKFDLVDDGVLAHVQVPAWPFAPQHLRSLLAMMTQTADEVDADLAVRLGGRRFLDEYHEDGESDELDETVDASGEDEQPDEVEDPSSPWHAALHTLHQLDAESPGSVDPELAALICGNDRGLLLRLIGHEEEQEIAWRHARDEALRAGDPMDVAEVSRIESEHARQTVNLLRRALRVVVERERGRQMPGESDARARPRAKRAGRPRPARSSPEQAGE